MAETQKTKQIRAARVWSDTLNRIWRNVTKQIAYFMLQRKHRKFFEDYMLGDIPEKLL